MYRLNLRRLIRYLLPISLRTNIVDFLTALCSPFSLIHAQFAVFRNKCLDDLSYNSQYPNMQRLLNDRFDTAERRIKTYDGTSYIGIVVYPKAEQIAAVTPLLIHSNSEYVHPQFVIELPIDFENDNNIINRIRETVNIYKFDGVKYKIIYR